MIYCLRYLVAALRGVMPWSVVVHWPGRFYGGGYTFSVIDRNSGLLPLESAWAIYALQLFIDDGPYTVIPVLVTTSYIFALPFPRPVRGGLLFLHWCYLSSCVSVRAYPGIPRRNLRYKVTPLWGALLDFRQQSVHLRVCWCHIQASSHLPACPGYNIT